ncbi:MAG: SMC-Scp complex subunit ScpB [Gammaproteobacteria bacterium]|nr:SMC-Scp complex subunit ScpB [Gammaproteobacteria bacterium]MCF6261880.1 SMC-Scp complex subunit ScpB [Gammaproteobacteria bacterium]
MSDPVSLSAVVLDPAKVKNIVEAALLAAGQPLSVDRLLNLFLDENQPSREELSDALAALAEECANRGVELVEVGSGFRYQAKQENAQWIARLWEEKPARYSRALLETLALIAYRQPITRGEIEDVRGVSVSTSIIKTLMERDWVKVVGHRDVPGKPAMYASTKQFLDYFNLKGLSDLPTLAEIRDIDSINAELDLTEPGSEYADADADTENTSENENNTEDMTVTNINETESAETETGEQAPLVVSDTDMMTDETPDAEKMTELDNTKQNAEKSAVTTADPA